MAEKISFRCHQVEVPAKGQERKDVNIRKITAIQQVVDISSLLLLIEGVVQIVIHLYLGHCRMYFVLTCFLLFYCF